MKASSATKIADVESVWIDGELIYGTAAVVQTVRPTWCEAVMVQDSAKRLCTPVFPLVNALGNQFPWVVPVVRRGNTEYPDDVVLRE